jgi:hypothetical protein
MIHQLGKHFHIHGDLHLCASWVSFKLWIIPIILHTITCEFELRRQSRFRFNAKVSLGNMQTGVLFKFWIILPNTLRNFQTLENPKKNWRLNLCASWVLFKLPTILHTNKSIIQILNNIPIILHTITCECQLTLWIKLKFWIIPANYFLRSNHLLTILKFTTLLNKIKLINLHSKLKNRM